MKSIRKKLLATSALAFILCASSAVAFSTNVEAAKAATGSLSDFSVVVGGSIKAGTVEAETGKVSGGIRFCAELPKSVYEELDDNGETVTAGTFIMPYSYIANVGEINEANCFGEQAKYWWEGKSEAQPSGTKQIIQLNSKPFIAETSYNGLEGEVYRIQGSVVNLYVDNLERDYVGVPYIAVTSGEAESQTTTYYFANGYEENVRSPLQVAYNAYLTGDTKSKEIASGYVDAYVQDYQEDHDGADPTRQIEAQVFINSYTGEYVKSATRSKTVDVPFTNATELTQDYAFEDLQGSLDTLDKVTAITGIENEKATTKIALDNTATVKGYFDEEQVDVLFDMSKDPDAAKGSELTYNGATVSSVTDYNYHFSSDWGWHGAKSLYVQDFKNGSESQFSTNITYTNAKELTQPTDTFSFMMKFRHYVDADTTSQPLQHFATEGVYPWTVQITDKDGVMQEKTVQINVGTNYMSGLEHEPRQVVATLDSPIASVSSISFRAKNRTAAYYIDYICAEYTVGGGATIGGADATVNGDKIIVSGRNPVTVTTASLFSTVYNSEEFVPADIKVEAKTFQHKDTLSVGATGATVSLSKAENTYSFAAINDYYTLSVEKSYTVGADTHTETTKYTVFGYHENVICNFDTDIVEAGIATISYANEAQTQKKWYCAAGKGIDGSYGAKCDYAYGSVWYLDTTKMTDFSITGECTKVSFWIGDRYWWNNELQFKTGDAFGIGVEGFDLGTTLQKDSKEWVYVELALNSTITQATYDAGENKKFAIPGTKSQNCGFVVDNIALK